MHLYDVPRRQSFQPVRSVRPGRETPGGPSATPIYDALYAEYVRSYRTLPGDRSGEEDLGFVAFGLTASGGAGRSAGQSPVSFGPGSYRAYSAGASLARHAGAGRSAPPQVPPPAPSPAQAPPPAPSQPQWQRIGTLPPQHGTGTYHVPAALPPARRGGL
ncbi:hypothetical protein [Streptomyces sp. NPDC047000]|uniref:hypothetical protein n=1 Tax=Streptomyces sp. NPDC047000 TaxID=3155474 RepID=UPI0033C52119